MDQNGPFWPEEVHFGPFRSANRTQAIPEQQEPYDTNVPSRAGTRHASLDFFLGILGASGGPG